MDTQKHYNPNYTILRSKKQIDKCDSMDKLQLPRMIGISVLLPDTTTTTWSTTYSTWKTPSLPHVVSAMTAKRNSTTLPMIVRPYVGRDTLSMLKTHTIPPHMTGPNNKSLTSCCFRKTTRPSSSPCIY